MSSESNPTMHAMNHENADTASSSTSEPILLGGDMPVAAEKVYSSMSSAFSRLLHITLRYY
jgi:hypothetical protein